MDGNNWRAAQAQGGEGAAPAGAASGAMDSGDWRTQLLPDSRQRIVNKIMETLKRHLPVSGQEGVQELKKIAVRFEEKIYSAATSQQDYLRKISLKMLTMETKSQNPMTNSIPPNPATNGQNALGPGSHSMQSQVNSQAQQLPVANPTQTRQPLLQQNIQNNMASTVLQNSASLTPALPSVSNLTQGTMPNVVGQNSNLQTMQNIPNVGQNSVGNAIGQGMPPNMVANSQRQMQGRQQQVVSQQQQQQSQTTQQYLYQQQLHHQMMKQKFQPGSTSQSLMQSHMQQQPQEQKQQQQLQQQQNLLQPTQTQPSQQAMMQPSSMQSTSLSNLQQNQQSTVQQSTQSVLHQRQQSVMRQQQLQQGPILHQQQSSMLQQPILPQQQHQQQQQQQQLIAQQTNVANLQQNQLMGQQNTMPDVQQRLVGQQNNYNSLQQQQQQLLNQQNNFQNMHQQQLGSQSNIAGVQQQQLSGSQQPGNSGLTSNQHPIHMLQQPKVPVQQQMLQSTTSLLPSQGQQSQSQPAQQQMMSQSQSQPGQLQPPLVLQQQTNQLQREMQQRLQPSAPLLQQQNVMEQKQLYQSQRAAPEASSTSLDSTAQTGSANAADWQEEVYQKIKSMKEMYLSELNDLYQKIASKVQQHDSLPQRPQNEQIEKLKMFKMTLERIVLFLRLNKHDIQLTHKEKLLSVEKHISFFLSSNRPRKPTSSPLQGQLPQSSMQLQQPQSLDGQTNPSMQPVQGSMATMQQNNLTNLQHNSLSGVSTISNSQQHMINTVQPGSSVDLGQGNSLNSLQQVATGSLQQNPVNSPQQVNISSLSSQSGTNPVQANLSSLQQNSNALQQSLPKQHEQQMLQNQQLRQQYHHRHIQQQFFQRQQLIQQQQPKQQQTPLLPTHQMSQLHQMTDANDLKMRQQMGMKTGVLQQQQSVGQRVGSLHTQLKPGISSPQLHQALSPQVTQHSSPQIDQQNMLATLTKTGTPLQSASSPFVVPSPSTPLAPSPMPGDSEKISSGLASHTTAGNIMHQQSTVASAPAQSLAIGTPGISASPLLAEFTPLDGTHANVSAAVSGKSSVEQPLERLMKVVKNMSAKALNSSVSDISSVVSMIDRIAGSAPGNGSRAAVGEDLVAMTKCRLQARNYFTHDGPTGTKKMKRYTTSNVVSSSGSVNDSFWQLNCSEASELESTATSNVKRPRLEVNHALVEEIQNINRQLIDTVVEISDEGVDPSAFAAATEGGEGTTVKCSFTAVALSPNLKSQYASAQMSPIQPLRLLVPVNYPNCSPILLDKFPVEVSKEYEDLSMKAKSRFSVSLRSLSQPMSLKDIARTWDVCARAIISEYAQQSGGGTFSSKYGSWENCLSAA